VAFTGCDSVASRVAFDKVLTKQRCIDSGIPTARFVVLDSPRTSWPAGWRPPVVLKPVRQGSSVGLQFVERVDGLQSALTEALRYDREVLMEERIVGREVTVGILAGDALPVVEIRPRQGGFDYHNKYTAGATEYSVGVVPADVTARTSGGLGGFEAVGGRDFGRVDVMINEAGEPMVLEVNTVPGLTIPVCCPRPPPPPGFRSLNCVNEWSIWHEHACR
jgi:D-alanine-D-alanine ligase